MEPTKVFTVHVSQQGRITIPDEMRKLLNIEEGDMIQCEILTIKKKQEANPH